MSEKPDFEQLVRAHSREIHAYLWRMMGDSADAEDCLQESFLRAYRAYSRLDGKANTRAWLYKIATNTARSHLKKRGRTSSRTADIDPALISNGPALGEQVEQRELLHQVKAAVEGLPHKQRAAVMMRKYQEMSYPEIALALNSSEDAVRANVYQALKKLRSQLNEHV